MTATDDRPGETGYGRLGRAFAEVADPHPDLPEHPDHIDEFQCGQCGDWLTADQIVGHGFAESRDLRSTGVDQDGLLDRSERRLAEAAREARAATLREVRERLDIGPNHPDYAVLDAIQAEETTP